MLVPITEQTKDMLKSIRNPIVCRQKHSFFAHNTAKIKRYALSEKEDSNE
jgi:hypothetical protein